MRTRPVFSSSYPVTSIDGHQTVLLHEAIDLLKIKSTDVVVDATLGAAGHAKAIVEKLGSNGVFVGFDLDADAIERTQSALAGAKSGIHLIESNFREIADRLHALNITHVDKALFDLGWSGYQLDAGRGFSFNTDDPLLMTYAKNPASDALTARTIVNDWKEESLADIIFGWGEERFARRIAKAIVARREEKPIETARELAEIVQGAVPVFARRGRIHPATKTFQALRIAVNDELGALEGGLRGAWRRLSPGGRIAVIAFHSIEDRLVKREFSELEKRGEGKRITKKPLTPSDKEIKENPRARSAKLRVIEKI
ncbi:16S rRNA (cytosine(1402)-N(4))-methyltransferase RsmH [Candidatus Kaiserbacteria bacterium]|nr:16S rRNA (cytosine(1402)-N(4))-methyltransferase RsmH [Candidatus Kaiserbacteria bacterium]